MWVFIAIALLFAGLGATVLGATATEYKEALGNEFRRRLDLLSSADALAVLEAIRKADARIDRIYLIACALYIGAVASLIVAIVGAFS